METCMKCTHNSIDEKDGKHNDPECPLNGYSSDLSAASMCSSYSYLNAPGLFLEGEEDEDN